MNYKPLLVDLGGLDACCTDHALEQLAKAISGEEGDSHDIWEPHHSPFVSRLIELFTARGLTRIQQVAEQLDLWLAGAKHAPHAGAPVARPDGMLERWTPAERDLVRLYLESLPAAAFTLDDWALVVDYLLQTYLPADELLAEARWLAARSSIMGRVQAHVPELTLPQADVLVAALPLTIAAARTEFRFSDAFDHILDYADWRCCENVVSLTEANRRALRSLIVGHQAAVLQGDPAATKQALQSKLFDRFGAWNRDWRRIAITETGENCNQGVIASLPLGARVKRIEMYKGACPFCRRIDGTVLSVVDPAAKDKDGVTQVWVGKTNIGRSAAPRKRVGAALVERAPAELWWVPAGTVHPHCRGSWHVMAAAKPGDDAGFQSWLDRHLHRNRAPVVLGQ